MATVTTDQTTRRSRAQLLPAQMGGGSGGVPTEDVSPPVEEIDLASTYLRHLTGSGEGRRWVCVPVHSLKFKAKKWHGADLCSRGGYGSEPYISNKAMEIAAERFGLERRVRGPDLCYLVPDPDRFAKAELDRRIRRVKRGGDALWPDWGAPKLRKVGRGWFPVRWRPVLAHEVTDRLEEARRHRPHADSDPRVRAIQRFTYQASDLRRAT